MCSDTVEAWGVDIRQFFKNYRIKCRFRSSFSGPVTKKILSIVLAFLLTRFTYRVTWDFLWKTTGLVFTAGKGSEPIFLTLHYSNVTFYFSCIAFEMYVQCRLLFWRPWVLRELLENTENFSINEICTVTAVMKR